MHLPRLMRPSILRIARFLPCLALLAAPGCGDDDGGGGGTEASSTGVSSTGASSTGGGSTSTDPGGTTTTGNSDSGEGSSGPGEGSSSGTAADGGSSETGAGTGAIDCPAQADQAACEGTMGCLWLGNMQNGVCVIDDAAICPELEMQACQQHPQCVWSNQDAICDPAGM